MKYEEKDSSGNRDFITNLPDDIISNILSHLETKDAVQTRVLSKAWEYKWTSIYNIDIYEWPTVVGKMSSRCDRWLASFANFVDMVLLNAHNVRRFHFHSDTDSPKEYENIRMKTWLFSVFRRNVEEVQIETYHSITLPRSLLTCTSLRELDIDMPCTWKTPVRVYFPNLTRLSLIHVCIENDSNSDTLVFHFPVLKTFEIRLHEWLNVKSVEFYAPALISFLSENIDGYDIDSYIVKIVGASLQKFESRGPHLENFILSGSTVSYAALKNDCNVDDSVDVDDNIVQSGLRIRRLLKQFSNLKSLKLTCYLAQVLAGTKPGRPLSRFAKLERLALSSGDGCTGGKIERIFEGLFELLRSAPVLKSLTIEGFYWLGLDSQDDEFDMMEPVPSCVVSHLEEFKIKFYSGLIQELNLTKYFVENGAQLKKLSLRCRRGIGKDEVRYQLSKFHNASTSLQIILT